MVKLSKKILQANEIPIDTEVQLPKRSQTQAGMLMDETNVVYRAEETMREFNGALPAKLIDTALIDFSPFANRHVSSFKSVEFDNLKRDISITGKNSQPIKVRPKNGRYEVVFGHRRTIACKELNIPVFAIIEDMTDHELWLEMQEENESRKDLSAFEQAMHYKKAIDNGFYKNWSSVADALKKSRAAISRYTSLANLPNEVISIFPLPSQISLESGQAIAIALEKDRSKVMAVLESLKNQNLTTSEIVKKLSLKEEVLTTVNTSEKIAIKKTSSGYRIELKTKKLSTVKIQELRDFLTKLEN